MNSFYFPSKSWYARVALLSVHDVSALFLSCSLFSFLIEFMMGIGEIERLGINSFPISFYLRWVGVLETDESRIDILLLFSSSCI